MTDAIILVDRKWWSFQSEIEKGMSVEDYVKEYLRQLMHSKDVINNNNTFEFARLMFPSKEIESKILEQLDKEITYCKFYLSLKERERKDPDFYKWKYETAEENTGNFGYGEKAPGERFIRTNGRVKAIIQVDRTKSMVGIELSFRDDTVLFTEHRSNSDHALKFLDYEKAKELNEKSHMKNESKIEQRIENYKTRAEEVLMQHVFPLWCPEKNRFENLMVLLDVEGATKC